MDAPARDLAMLEESLRFNFSADAIPMFYAQWPGDAPDPKRVEAFSLLDELLTYSRASG